MQIGEKFMWAVMVFCFIFMNLFIYFNGTREGLLIISLTIGTGLLIIIALLKERIICMEESKHEKGNRKGKR